VEALRDAEPDTQARKRSRTNGDPNGAEICCRDRGRIEEMVDLSQQRRSMRPVCGP
jgi:hypothetical protein